MNDHYANVRAQFDPVAKLYATSTTHSSTEALDRLVALLAPNPSDTLLDIATGAGSVAIAFAPYCAAVIGLDLAPAMLDETHRRAVELGLTNLTVVEGFAEALPFPDASFDLVTVRTAPHHYLNVQNAIAEMARVAKPSGKFLIVDTCSPEDDALTAEINVIERLRDPSHVRNYKPSEWHEMVASANLTIEFQEVGFHALGKLMDFQDWLDRQAVPQPVQEELLARFDSASPELVNALKIAKNGSSYWFTLPEITLVLRHA